MMQVSMVKFLLQQGVKPDIQNDLQFVSYCLSLLSYRYQ
jgi:hypothetical protein